MATVEIYTSPLCGFCHAAKRLLDTKGVSFTEYDVGRDPDLRRPRGFSEKILWRKIHDRNPLFPLIHGPARPCQP